MTYLITVTPQKSLGEKKEGPDDRSYEMIMSLHQVKEQPALTPGIKIAWVTFYMCSSLEKYRSCEKVMRR